MALRKSSRSASNAEHVRFFVQFGSLEAGSGKVECPKFRICLIDTVYVVASQPDEFPSVVSKWQTGRFAVAGFVDASICGRVMPLIVAERSVINS